MLVYVDESGDPGMQFKPGSSDFFIISAVLFDDEASAKACSGRINEIREELKFHRGTEFHFNKTSRPNREYFFRGIDGQAFRYFSFALNKRKLTGPGFAFRNSFYKQPVKFAFENVQPHLCEATVIFDRCGERKFTAELERYLCRQINKGTPAAIRRVRSERSHGSNLVQMADMVCGAIARSYKSTKVDRHVYRSLIGRHEMSVRLWPK